MIAAPARAQTYTLPEIGFESSGDCRQLAVRDRDSKAMVPMGCMSAGKWRLQPDALQILGPGSSGDGSGFSATAPFTGAQAYSLAERAGDEVNVMAFIPVSLRAAIRNETSTADLTAYIRNALATGKRVRFPKGRYPVCDMLPLASGQAMVGDGVSASYLWVSSCFNMSAPAVVQGAAGDSSGWDALGIRFDQSSAAATISPVPLSVPPDIGGSWNAATNTPALTTNSPYFAGRYLTVTQAGSRFGQTWNVGDRIVSAGGGVPWRRAAVGSANFDFASASTNARAALVKYPSALDISVATRFKLGTIRISNAWNGLICAGNCGGFEGGMIEVSAYNKAILFDGVRDFVHIGTAHIWPFDAAGTILESVIYDGKVMGFEFGRVDGMFVRNLAPFNATVYGNGGGAASAARTIVAMMLDGDGSDFKIDSGDLQIGIASSTKNGLATPWAASAMTFNSTGNVSIASLRTLGATQGAALKQTAGYVNISGGSVQQLRTDFPAIETTGGIMQVNGTQFLTASGGARTAAMINANGGAIIAKGNAVLPRAANPSGPFIAVAQDFGEHTIQNNDFNTLSLSVPAGARAGDYGPNKVAPFIWTPTPAFDGGNGTFSVSSYAVQQGNWSYGAGKIDYNFRVYFTHGAYSGNSGNFFLSGLPFYASAIDFRPGAFSEFGGFTLTAGQLWAAPSTRADTTKPGIFPVQLGGASLAFIGPANVPTSAGTRYIAGSGSIPLR